MNNEFEHPTNEENNLQNPQNTNEPVQSVHENEQNPQQMHSPAAETQTAPKAAASTPGFNPYTGQPYGQPAAPAATKAPKNKGSFLKKAASTLALALIFGVVSGAVILGMTSGIRGGDGTASGDTAVTEQNSNTPQLNGSVSGQLQSASTTMQEALEKAQIAVQDTLTIPQINIIMEPAMVSINCLGETTIDSFFGPQTYQTASSGSGIIVGENETELLIVTNNHVIADTTEISVQFVDGTESKALVKGTDAINDLAIIVVNLSDIEKETMSAIAYAEIGDSDALVIGEGVVAIGNALGFGQSVTQGIVSALNRAVTDANGNTTYLIQTDAAINPGNSGGALVNMRGQVIGINSSKYTEESVEGMCFAIPVNTAMPILEELMSRTTRVEITDPEKAAYLGITPGQDISAQIAAAYKMPVGLYVAEVQPDGPSDNAGMYNGDIITKFDHDVITGISDLRKALSYYEAGETVEVTVSRLERGEYIEVVLTVTLGTYPTEEASPEDTPSQDKPSDHSGNDDNSYPSWFDFFGW